MPHPCSPPPDQVVLSAAPTTTSGGKQLGTIQQRLQNDQCLGFSELSLKKYVKRSRTKTFTAYQSSIWKWPEY